MILAKAKIILSEFLFLTMLLYSVVSDTPQLSSRVDRTYSHRAKLRHFVRSGNVNLGNGFSRNVGQNGYDWSATSTDTIWGNPGLGAYNLDFNASGLNSSNGPTNRYNGFPVRCLASGA